MEVLGVCIAEVVVMATHMFKLTKLCTSIICSFLVTIIPQQSWKRNQTKPKVHLLVFEIQIVFILSLLWGKKRINISIIKYKTDYIIYNTGYKKKIPIVSRTGETKRAIIYAATRWHCSLLVPTWVGGGAKKQFSIGEILEAN